MLEEQKAEYGRESEKEVDWLESLFSVLGTPGLF